MAIVETGILPKENFLSLTSLDTGCMRVTAHTAFAEMYLINEMLPSHTVARENIYTECRF